MEQVPEKVLMLDDDRNLLDSFKRQYRKRLNLVTSTSGADALQALTDDGPFAVVITDMQMPNMDGIKFLSHARIQAPDTVRIVLTGNANLQIAIQAVNEGNIFRFLNKPVEPDVLFESIIDGIQQNRMITAERMLLSKTLKGVVDLLSELLSLINPETFDQAKLIKQSVRNMVRNLNLAETWIYELAAMLSQLGYAILPKELLEKLGSEQRMDSKEIELFEQQPKTVSRLIKHIPRLETVAAIVEMQSAPLKQIELRNRLTADEKAIVGGQILKVAIAFNQRLRKGVPTKEAIAALMDDPDKYDPALVRALALGDTNDQWIEQLSLPVEKMEAGMVLDQAIHTAAGSKLVTKGQEINNLIRMRLLVARETGIISGTFKVFRVAERSK